MSIVPDPTAAAESRQALAELNAWLSGLTAPRRIQVRVTLVSSL